MPTEPPSTVDQVAWFFLSAIILYCQISIAVSGLILLWTIYKIFRGYKEYKQKKTTERGEISHPIALENV